MIDSKTQRMVKKDSLDGHWLLMILINVNEGNECCKMHMTVCDVQYVI